MGATAVYVDDELYGGLPQHAPVGPEDDTALNRQEPGLKKQLERHTSEEEGLERGPMVTDPVVTAVTPEVRADAGETNHQDRPPIYLSVYPGWIFITPPREFWPPRPTWGGFEALWHQRTPRTVNRDFSYWSLDRGVLIRFHAAPRRRMYVPSEATLPPGLTRDRLTGHRRTFIRFSNPTELEIEEDLLSDPRPQRQLRRSWTGRTEFQLRNQ